MSQNVDSGLKNGFSKFKYQGLDTPTMRGAEALRDVLGKTMEGSSSPERSLTPGHLAPALRDEAFSSIYAPLDHTKNEIRLLVLFPRREEHPGIRCWLCHESLDGVEDFAALSYDPSDTREIFVQDVSIQVTANLEAALRELQETMQQDSDNFRLLWVDALCINQGDIEEKSREILRMRSIYEASYEVIAWLGVAADDSDLAMDVMNHHVRETVASKALVAFPFESSEDLAADKAYMAILKLFSRPFWQRVWTMQETAVAKNLIVLCGTRYIEWFFLGPIINIVLKTARKQTGEQLDVAGIKPGLIMTPVQRRQFHRDAVAAGNEIKLLQLVLTSLALLVTDPRDRIYGFLGLASDARDLVPVPDYSLTTAEVFVAFTKAVITTSKDLRVICLFQSYVAAKFQLPGHRSLILPTWTPDWQLSLLYNSMVALELCHDAAKDRDYAATRGSQAIAEFSDDGKVLIVKGYIFDSIDGLGWQDFGHLGLTVPTDSAGKLPYNAASSISLTASQPALYDVIQSTSTDAHRSEEVYGSHEGIFEAIWRSLVTNRDIQIKSPAPDVWGLCFSFLCHSELSKPGINHDFRRWALRNARFKIDGDPLGRFLGETMRDKLMERVPEDRDAGFNSSVDIFLEHMQLLDFDKRLVTTEGGYIGKAPGGTRKGDSICLLFGCGVPFVLRKRGEGGYRVVGESYIMNGEAWTHLEGREPQIFSIH